MDVNFFRIHAWIESKYSTKKKLVNQFLFFAYLNNNKQFEIFLFIEWKKTRERRVMVSRREKWYVNGFGRENKQKIIHMGLNLKWFSICVDVQKKKGQRTRKAEENGYFGNDFCHSFLYPSMTIFVYWVRWVRTFSKFDDCSSPAISSKLKRESNHFVY